MVFIISNDREPMTSRMSPLTLGTGKVIRADNVDKLELHLNTGDYSNLLTQRLRPSDCFSVIRTEQNNRTMNTRLPKTFITRSGSLILYSDSKIMKESTDQFPLLNMSDTFKIQGARLALPSQHEKPTWKKNNSSRQTHKVGQKASLGREEYLEKKRPIQGLRRSANQNSKRTPYAWNYAITPVKVSGENKEVSVKTVKDLSEALLGYRLKQITDKERYENIVNYKALRYKGNGKTKDRISAWTMDCLRSPTRAPSDYGFTRFETRYSDSHFRLLQRARTDLNLVSSGIVPTNTPLSTSDRNGLGTRERPKTSGIQRRNQSPTSRDTEYIYSPLYQDISESQSPHPQSPFSQDIRQATSLYSGDTSLSLCTNDTVHTWQPYPRLSDRESHSPTLNVLNPRL